MKRRQLRLTAIWTALTALFVPACGGANSEYSDPESDQKFGSLATSSAYFSHPKSGNALVSFPMYIMLVTKDGRKTFDGDINNWSAPPTQTESDESKIHAWFLKFKQRLSNVFVPEDFGSIAATVLISPSEARPLSFSKFVVGYASIYPLRPVSEAKIKHSLVAALDKLRLDPSLLAPKLAGFDHIELLIGFAGNPSGGTGCGICDPQDVPYVKAEIRRARDLAIQAFREQKPWLKADNYNAVYLPGGWNTQPNSYTFRFSRDIPPLAYGAGESIYAYDYQVSKEDYSVSYSGGFNFDAIAKGHSHVPSKEEDTAEAEAEAHRNTHHFGN